MLEAWCVSRFSCLDQTLEKKKVTLTCEAAALTAYGSDEL